MRKQFNPNREVMSTVLASAIRRGTGAKWYAPFATGQMDLPTWLSWVNSQNAERQDGTSYPAIYQLMGGGSYSVSSVVRQLWAANKMGLLPYTQAVHQGEAFRALVEGTTHAFAAQLGRAVPEVTAATVRIRTQQQEASASRNWGEEIREAAQEYRTLLDAGRLTDHEYQLLMQDLTELAKEARWAKEAMGNAVMDSDTGNPSPDEGSVETALHNVSDLWHYEAKDVLGAETAMVEAFHAFTGQDLPIHDARWEWVTERLAESWAMAMEYAKDDVEREVLARKTEYRAAIAEGGLTAQPNKARWAVNHIARRIWRDRTMLKQRVQWWQDAIGRTGETMAREEKYGMPARATRMLSDQPRTETEDGSERSHFLIWDTVRECDIAPDFTQLFTRDVERVGSKDGDIQYYKDREGELSTITQGEYDILVREALIERAEAIIGIMDDMYAKVRAVDEALTPIWQEMQNDEMPAAPPVYWNNKGFYLTEEEAMAAIAAEAAERKERTLAGVQDLMAQMLAAQGWIN